MEENKFNATKYKNQFAKENYEFIRLNLPKGMKARIKERADSLNESVNKYIRDLIIMDLEQFRKETDAVTPVTSYRLLAFHMAVNANMYKPPFPMGYTLADRDPVLFGTYTSMEEAIAGADGKSAGCSSIENGVYKIEEYFVEIRQQDAEGQLIGEVSYEPIMRYEKIWPGSAGVSVRKEASSAIKYSK